MADAKDLYKEALFHLVRAARDFNLRAYQFANVPSVHVMLSADERPIMFNDQIAAWKAWTGANRASLVSMTSAKHAIPDAQPDMAAKLTMKFLSKTKGFQGGK